MTYFAWIKGHKKPKLAWEGIPLKWPASRWYDQQLYHETSWPARVLEKPAIWSELYPLFVLIKLPSNCYGLSQWWGSNLLLWQFYEFYLKLRTNSVKITGYWYIIYCTHIQYICTTYTLQCVTSIWLVESWELWKVAELLLVPLCVNCNLL